MVVSLTNVSAFYVGLWVAGGSTAIVWVLSLVTGDHSWVDRIWSIIPVVYLWIFAGAAGLADTRLDVMAVLVTLWGARLTFNFARKGGYAPGGEDYRWAVLRGGMTNWQFQLFNLFFIAAYQNALLFAISLPALTAEQHRGGFGGLDVLAALLFLVLLAGETLADQQQWNFHRRKRVESEAGRQIEQMVTYSAVGTPGQVRDYLQQFAELSDADELITAHQTADTESRLRSVELTADALTTVSS